MTYNYHRHNSCALCGYGEMRMVNAFLARCTECGDTMSYGFFDTLRQIRKLPDARGAHACECGHPEMRRLPGRVYRCPSCGSEIAYPTRGDDKNSNLPGGLSFPKRESQNSRQKDEDRAGENETAL
jgi:ribosomal protein L37AE/L43A